MYTLYRISIAQHIDNIHSTISTETILHTGAGKTIFRSRISVILLKFDQ